ncbi:MAG: hypothetical protein KIT83_03240, partial [Bryobacterales bacterium]|nr:hypothetical protein [Bryobacterales bacterium]
MEATGPRPVSYAPGKGAEGGSGGGGMPGVPRGGGGKETPLPGVCGRVLSGGTGEGTGVLSVGRTLGAPELDVRIPLSTEKVMGRMPLR